MVLDLHKFKFSTLRMFIEDLETNSLKIINKLEIENVTADKLVNYIHNL